jgi:hypothetical protein
VSVGGASTPGGGECDLVRGAYRAGKKVNGHKRFIVTGTMGLLITVMVCAAGVHGQG